MTLKFCRQCVLPDSRPGIEIDATGVCSGCRSHNAKSTRIDWPSRAKALERIVDAAKAARAPYDCIVPVSGGKDSTWQVAVAKEMGLKVLAVTWRSPGRNALGQQNLDNLIALGVDHIDYSIDPGVESLFMRKTFEATGSTAVPMHLALYTIPLKLAVSLRIPLVIWGESPFMEYGGDPGDSELDRLDHAWLTRHGILQGRRAEDWIDDDLDRKALEPYCLPSPDEFEKRRIQSIFLGFYMPWDPVESLRVARCHGFQIRPEGPKIGLYDYADIDCDFIAVHHWFKWHKFGFTRLFDNLALEIRNGRMDRAAAIGVIERLGLQRPDQDIDSICRFMGIDDEQFAAIEDRFRNPDIWQHRDGCWQIDGFLTKNWDWRAGRAAPAAKVA